ncbi:MAG: ABC transporter permease [Bacteroidia bacterium]|nr:ABC transporter permease [Bacteroidia bacterium]
MSGLSFNIAQRYLYGKKSANSINIITGISVFGISIGTAALILILSVFNGLEGLLSGLFNAFNPDLKVLPYEGKFFEVDDETYDLIKQIPNVEAVSKTIEEVALIEYKGSKEIGVLKGVDEQYVNVTGLDSLMVSGDFFMKKNQINYAIVGSGLRNKLSLSIEDRLSPMTIYMPQKKKKIIGAKEFKSKDIYLAGVFSVKSDTDYKYLISNMTVVSSLLDQKKKISSLEIKVKDKAEEEAVREKIIEILGEGFVLNNRYEQDEAYLKVMAIERLFSFLITGLTIVLIAFNLVGALWMIVLEKQKDIAVLKAMGYTKLDIKAVFIKLGLLITSIGIILGFIIALIIYYIQKEYGILGFSDGFLIDAYPVKIKVQDFILSTITVLFIGWLASLLPAFKAADTEMVLKGQ